MAKRKYTQKQIDALANIGDAEFAQALYSYTKDRPLARLGLDAYLFEAGQIDPDNFKQKLLNIKQYPTQRLQRSDGNVVAGRYFREEDTIKLFADAFIYKDKTTGKRKKGKGYKGPGQIETLLHELEHRGYKFLNTIVPLEDYVNVATGSQADSEIQHIGMYDREAKTAKDLNIEREAVFNPDDYTQKDLILNIQKEREKKGLKSSRVKKRFPSIKQYNRGGKVYTNQPRRVRISRGR